MEEIEHIKRKQIEFEEKLRTARSTVQAVVVSRTPDDWDREEIVSEAEDRFRDKMRGTNWTLEIKSFLAYELKIADGIIIDTWRRYGDFQWYSFDDDRRPQAQERLVNEASKRCDLALNVETKIYLQELDEIIPWDMLFKDLAKGELHLIQMHYADGISFADIGDAVGKPGPVVKAEVERSLARIRYRARRYLKEKGLTSLFRREA